MIDRQRAYRRALTFAIVFSFCGLLLMTNAVSCGGGSGGGNVTALLGSDDGNCVACHTGITIMHDRFQLSCVDCHGGDAAVAIDLANGIRDPNEIVKAHVAPEGMVVGGAVVTTAADTVNNRRLFRANALTGFDAVTGLPVERGSFFDPEFFDRDAAGVLLTVDFDPDDDIDGVPDQPQASNLLGAERDDIAGEHVDSEYNEDLNYVRWLNPSDLRVAQASCGRLSSKSTFVGQCHQQEVDALRLHNMSNIGGVVTGAYYQNRQLPNQTPPGNTRNGVAEQQAIDITEREGFFGFVLDYEAVDGNYDAAINGWPAGTRNKSQRGILLDQMGELPLDTNGDGVPDLTDAAKVTMRHGAFGADAPAGAIETHRIRGVGGNQVRDPSRARDRLESFPDRVVAEGNVNVATAAAILIVGLDARQEDAALQPNDLVSIDTVALALSAQDIVTDGRVNGGVQGNGGDTGDSTFSSFNDISMNPVDSAVYGFRPFQSLLAPAIHRNFFGLKVAKATIDANIANGTPFELIAQNNPVGTFRNTGCASCHVLYDADGISSEPTDPTVRDNGREATNALPFGFVDEEGRAAHPVKHQLTTRIPTEQCQSCHVFVTRVPMMYRGGTEIEAGLDQDQEYIAGLGRDRTYTTPAGTVVSINANVAHFTFDGVTQTLVNDGEAVTEDLNNNGELDAGEDANGNGRLDLPDRFARSEATDGRQLHFAYGGANGSTRLQDIHLERGMECIDCHFLQDNHGDGNQYARNWDVIEIECDDCHGTATQRATLITSGPNGGNDLTQQFDRGDTPGELGLPFFQRLSDGTIIQRSRVVPGRTFVVPQIVDAITPGNPSFNIDAQEAMDVASTSFGGLNAHIREFGDQAGGNGGMECYSCHNAYTMNCFSCHVNLELEDALNIAEALLGAGGVAGGGGVINPVNTLVTDGILNGGLLNPAVTVPNVLPDITFTSQAILQALGSDNDQSVATANGTPNSRGKRQRGSFLDTRLRPGFTQFQVFSFVRAPMILQVNADGEFNKVSPFRSLMELHAEVSLDIPGYGIDGLGDDTLVHNVIFPTSNGLSGQALQMFMPHTVRLEETKDCDACHTLENAVGDSLNNHLLSQTFGLGTGRMSRMFDWAFVVTNDNTSNRLELVDLKREVEGQLTKVWPGFVGLTGGGFSDGSGPHQVFTDSNGNAIVTSAALALQVPRTAQGAISGDTQDVVLIKNVTVPVTGPPTALDLAIVTSGTAVQAFIVSGRDNPHLAPLGTTVGGVPFVVDLGDTVNALELVSPDFPGPFPGSDLNGGPLVFAGTDGGLHVVEVTRAQTRDAANPLAPTTADPLNPLIELTARDGIATVGGVVDIVIAGRIAYTLNRDGEIHVVDLSNKNLLTDLTAGAIVDVSAGNGRAMALQGELLYVLHDNGLDILKVDHRGGVAALAINPVDDFTGGVMTDPRAISIYGNRAIVAGGDQGVHLLDITISGEPAVLKTLGSITAPFGPDPAAASDELTITFGANVEATSVVMTAEPGPAGTVIGLVGTASTAVVSTGHIIGLDLTDPRNWRERIVNENADGSLTDDALFGTNFRFSLQRRDPLSRSSPFNGIQASADFDNLGDAAGRAALGAALKVSEVGSNPNFALNNNLNMRSGPTIFIGQTVYIWNLAGGVRAIAHGSVMDRPNTETGDIVRDFLEPGVRGLSLDEMERLRNVRVIEAVGTQDESGNGLGNITEK